MYLDLIMATHRPRAPTPPPKKSLVNFSHSYVLIQKQKRKVINVVI